MRWLVLVLLAACWRGSAPSEPTPASFIARKNAVVELNRSADAAVAQLEYALQRIIGLASEAERDAIRNDLAMVERDIARLSRYVGERRARGDSAVGLDAVERKLEQAALAVVQLREELVYAKTTAELAALDELSRQHEQDRDEFRQAVLRRLNALVEQTRPEPVKLLERPGPRATVRLGETP